ncbi:MAG: pro-sigmaK processing inhibitor BofA [Clostridiaceae bacterium]|nr:pro-sigmaK processing inhibitor BofA [Clostridiaceae bacterium]
MDKILIVLAWIVGVLIIVLLGKTMLLPLKVMVRLVINAIIGGIAILIINVIGGPLGFTIPLNPLSALIAGILGLPGIILVVILKYLL